MNESLKKMFFRDRVILAKGLGPEGTENSPICTVEKAFDHGWFTFHDHDRHPQATGLNYNSNTNDKPLTLMII